MSWNGYQAFNGFPQKRLSPAAFRVGRDGTVLFRDNASDIGGSSSTSRPRSVFPATSVTVGQNATLTATALTFFSNAGQISFNGLILANDSSTSILQIGADAAAPVAQTLKGCDARAGTDTDAAGGNFTLAAGRNTGAGVGGSLLFQTAPAGGGGTGAGTLTTLYQITGDTKMAWFGATAVVKQTSGANLTNNVTAGGTSDQIDNYTDLTIYANDAAAIRNAIYQLARKLKQINDGFRSYGLFT